MDQYTRLSTNTAPIREMVHFEVLILSTPEFHGNLDGKALL